MNRKQAHACSMYSGNLILVNALHPCRESPSADALVPVGEAGRDVLLDRRAASLLNKLMRDIRGWNGITAVSGWRSREDQQDIWDESLKEHGGVFTCSYVAVPGHSEHQTGLAVDLGLKTDTVDFLRPDFPYTGLCQRFRERAARYGFIQRYPAGKESVTGIAHEPWHFRFVGLPHAEILTELGLTLEEYLVFLKRFPDGQPFLYQKDGNRFSISYLASNTGQERLQRDESTCQMLSGNNVDGYIMTTWENGGGGNDSTRTDH